MTKVTNIARKYVNKIFVPARADILALQRLSALSLGFLPSSTEAMRPAAINTILNDIVVNQRSNIIEFGSGISTLYIAALIKEKGRGKLISFEHDETWLKIVKEMLVENSLSEFVSLQYAPLISEHPWFSESQTSWYDINYVSKVLNNIMIDLLIVDGPPAGSRLSGQYQYSRLPARFAVQSHLSSTHAIILDDFNRPGEQRIVKRWLENSKYELYDYALEAGIAYLRCGSGYVVAVQTR